MTWENQSFWLFLRWLEKSILHRKTATNYTTWVKSTSKGLMTHEEFLLEWKKVLTAFVFNKVIYKSIIWPDEMSLELKWDIFSKLSLAVHMQVFGLLIKMLQGGLSRFLKVGWGGGVIITIIIIKWPPPPPTIRHKTVSKSTYATNQPSKSITATSQPTVSSGVGTDQQTFSSPGPIDQHLSNSVTEQTLSNTLILMLEPTSK